jgi:multifunctional 2-oxoglutarate metabolism enzyme
VANGDALVCWEAQFGDFVNAGQVVVDQFIVAGEDKWDQQSSLVLLLPHGHEGQGPEHTSARLERFLTLAAEGSIQVTQPTTAAQYFHLLRRQAHPSVRKPLIVLTPKSLLRHPAARSAAADFTDGRFEELLDDPAELDRESVERVLLCTGKIAYRLLEQQDEAHAPVAVVRLEQLYPFPREVLLETLASYPNASMVRWVQEEPENMGAWLFVWRHLSSRLPTGRDLDFVARHESASPATGSQRVHEQEQQQIVEQAFSD